MGDATSTTRQNWTPEMAQAFNSLAKGAQDVYGNQVRAVSTAANPVVAPVQMSADTQQSRDMVRGWATGAGQQGADAAAQGLQYGLTGAMDVQNNPYLQQAIQASLRPVTEAYNDPGGVLANIRSDNVGSGQYGGTRQGLESGIAGGKYLQTIGDITAKMGSDAYDTGQRTFATALGFAPQTLKAGLLPGQAMNALGLQGEGYQQNQNDWQTTNNLWNLNKDWVPLQNFSNIINAQEPQSATTTNSGGGGGNPIGGMVAGAAAGAMMTPATPWLGGAIGAIIGLM